MKIAISGIGHMGAWLAKELRSDHEVAVYDRDEGRSGAIEGVTVLPLPSWLADFKPEFFINAVSLRNTISAIEESVPYLTKDCIICDALSIKTGMPDYYRESPFGFVSMHPMFGPTFANMDSLREENVVIISESDREGAEFFRRFFAGLGLKIFEYSFQEHDRMMAHSLTLPFIASMVFAASVDARAVPGTTFRKHMAITKALLSEDDSLLTEILFNPYSIAGVEKVTSRLEFLKHVMRGKDDEELAAFFKKLRNNIL